MSVRVMHLNLLQESERLSSSPVRLKVMLPIVTGFVLVAVIGWWVFLQLQLGLVGAEKKSLQDEVSRHGAAYAEACRLKGQMQAKEAELGQYRGYAHARRTWGETLAALAAVIPEGVQLTLLEIPEPPPQNLNPPPGVRLPALLGPTNTLEKVVFRLVGRTAKEESLFAFLKAVKANPALTNSLVFADGADASSQSPRIRRFRQDVTTDADGSRAIVFDVEYRTTGRDFAP